MDEMEAEACFCDFDYDAVAELHRETVRTARKEHTCIECEEPIKPGEKYHYVTQKCDGEFHEMKVCTPCERIRNNFCAPYYMLREMIHDYLGFDYVTGEY
jgi:hypothetical protein